MRFFKVIFATVFVIFGITFIVQNLEVLTRTVQLRMDLFFWKFQTPQVHLWGLILFSVFLGVFTASLYGLFEVLRQRTIIRKLRQNLEVLGAEFKRSPGSETSPGTREPQAPSRPV